VKRRSKPKPPGPTPSSTCQGAGANDIAATSRLLLQFQRNYLRTKTGCGVGWGVGRRKKCLQADCSNKTPNLNSRTKRGWGGWGSKIVEDVGQGGYSPKLLQTSFNLYRCKEPYPGSDGNIFQLRFPNLIFYRKFFAKIIVNIALVL
jgi:hypothetical protein